MDYYEQLAARPSYKDSLKILEADIQHANMLAASIPRCKGGIYFQMKVAYNQLAPFFLFLLQWIDCSSSCFLASYLNVFDIVLYKVHSNGRADISSYGRKATASQFYNVILPSLQRLHGDFLDVDITQEKDLKVIVKQRYEEKIKLSDVDLEREKECGICLEPCTKMVLPNCCHAMCINCYRDWNTRSESCPFCRGSIKRVDSGDLWVLTSGSDAVDTQTVLKEDMLRFYIFINNLPKDIPDALFLVYYEYLI